MRGIELTPEVPVGELTELGRAAETAGFGTVFASAHYNNRDPFVALDRIARATERVRVGPAAINPHETHPATLASRVATLDEASGGRAVLGIGPGDPSTLRNLGLAGDRGLRPVLEAFRAARRLWAGERIDHDGAFTAEDAGLNYTPPSGATIPVYVAGEGPHMCRMAAKHADGLLFNGCHPADLAWARERVEEGLAERSEERGEFELAAYAAVSVAEDRERAVAAARPPVAFVTAGAAPPVLERHGIEPDAAERIGELISAGEFSAAFEAVTEPMLAAFAAAGTPEEVADRLGTLREHADGVVLGAPLGPDEPRAIELLGDVT